MCPTVLREQQRRVVRVDEKVDHQDDGRGHGHVDGGLAGLGGLGHDLAIQPLQFEDRLGDPLDGLVEPAAALVAGQQGGGEEGEILAPQPLLGLDQRPLQRLAQVVLGDDLVELGVDRPGALGGQDLQRLGQRQAGAHGVGQHDHGVGQLVLDLLPVPLGHAPQQVPGRRGEEDRDQRGQERTLQRRSRMPTNVQPMATSQKSRYVRRLRVETRSRRSLSARSRSTASRPTAK